MGRLEREHKKRARKANIKKVVLKTVAVTGVLSVAVLVPNALGTLSKLGVVPHKRQKETVVNTKTRLVRQGLLAREDGLLRLTPKGERVLRIFLNAEKGRVSRSAKHSQLLGLSGSKTVYGFTRTIAKI